MEKDPTRQSSHLVVVCSNNIYIFLEKDGQNNTMWRLKMRHSRYFLSTIYVCLHNGWLASSFLTRPLSALAFHSHSTPAVNSASSWRSIAPGTLPSAFTQPSSIHNSIEPRHPSKSRLYEQSTQTQLSLSDQEVASSSSSPSSFAEHALLFSSLTDGIVPNPSARSFLRHSLLTLLLQERVAEREVGLKTSVEFSPCNGPDIDALTNLETVDDLLARGRDMAESVDFFDNLKETSNSSEMEHWSRETINHLLSNSQSIDVRILYIPTAMYALNPQSGNTPGKQRQRARADGKKRRAQLLQLLEELMFPTDGTEDDDFYGSDGNRKWNLLAVTLDLDDGSLKQPVGGYGDESLLFPEDDKAALTMWKPHIIYVEGGNTFWLQHCIEKGNYEPLIKNACNTKNANDDDFASIYMGKSAGAIVAGKTVATATWKGWDDPSIVPGKGTYEDWMDSKGLEMVGDCSFFPHMSDDWVELVEEKKKDILNIDGDDDDKEDRVICLREEDVCCVGGCRKSYISIRSGQIPSPQ